MISLPTIFEPAAGIKIIDDIIVQPGVETLEGRIGLLIRGAASQTHYIEMPPDLYVAEHPHETESFIYTVRGRWVLCSQAQRHVMEPGSLFWFGADIPTGYEVPFTEPALILIFKGSLFGSSEAFQAYLHNELQPRLLAEQAAGVAVFRLSALPADHPARLFADSLRR